MPTSTTSSNAPGPLEAWSHRAAEIPDRGLDIERVATPEELAVLADALQLPAISRMTVAYSIRPLGVGRYNVKGALSAAVTQECIVTLEAVHTEIQETLEEEFWAEDLVPAPLPDGERVEREALSGSSPEVIQQGLIEVGRLVYEQLSTAIDPYPRAPGAVFAWSEPGHDSDSSDRDKPFASLAALKDKT